MAGLGPGFGYCDIVSDDETVGDEEILEMLKTMEVADEAVNYDANKETNMQSSSRDCLQRISPEW